MNDDDLERRALALFEQLIDVAEADRSAWIEHHANGDPRLIARVNAVWQADRRLMMRTGGAVSSLDEEQPPERVGAYRIVDRIGQGGMGSVFRGERMTGDFSHAVAIKIIKPGLLSEALVERFERERQTLANLHHPNIAQLHDGGSTENGSPYIVMEHVQGLPLLQWLDKNAPGKDVRQRLFADICSAVAFANRALVVHRDLTPSNVLVTEDGTVKLIDFGISRPVAHGADTAGTSLASLSLTPGYAAPERMTSAEVTTAADIYSLGRLLENIFASETADTELRAIIRRATAISPTDRYSSAEALSADVEAWHRGFPVAAVGHQRIYVLRKFVGRHKLGVAAAVLGLVLLLGALVATTAAYKREEAARKAEAERFGQLRELARYMLFDLNARMERVAGNTAARADLAKHAQSYLSALVATRTTDPQLKLEVARGLIRLGQIQGLPTEPNLGERDQAKASLRQAEQLLTAIDIDPPAVASSLARTRGYLAMILLHGDGNQDAAQKLVEQAFAGLDAVTPAARSREWRVVRAELQRERSDLLLLSGKMDQLPAHAKQIADDVGQWPETERASASAAFELTFADYIRGLALNNMGSPTEALHVLRLGERKLRELDRQSPNDPVILNLLAWLAYEGYSAGSTTDREESRRFLTLTRQTVDRLTALESQDKSLQSFTFNVKQAQAEMLSADGLYPAALTLQQEVIEARSAAAQAQPGSSTFGRVAMAQTIQGNIALKSGDARRACDEYRRSAASFDKAKSYNSLLGRHEEFRVKLESNMHQCSAGKRPEAVS